jgi:6-phosphogluconolactonase
MIVLHPSGPEPRAIVHVAPQIAEVAGPMIAEAIQRRVREKGRCRLGLSGGGTPKATYAWLRQHLPLPIYSHLQVTWVDERHLPVQSETPGDWQAFDADSNLRLAYEEWLAHVPLPADRVLPMSLGGDLKAQVVRFGRSFLDQFGGGLDVTILGVGPDGHIASLFPGHPALEVDDVCLAVHDSPKAPAERLSLTLPVLRTVRYTFVLAEGSKKAEVLRRAWHGDPDLPLGRLQPAGDAHWILDPDAAAELVRETGLVT